MFLIFINIKYFYNTKTIINIPKIQQLLLKTVDDLMCAKPLEFGEFKFL